MAGPLVPTPIPSGNTSPAVNPALLQPATTASPQTTPTLNGSPVSVDQAAALEGSQATAPELPQGTALNPVMQQDNAADELTNNVALDPNAVGASQTVAQTNQASNVAPTPAATYQATTVSGQTPQMTGQTGQVTAQDQVSAQQGTADPNSLISGAQGTVDPRATIQGQDESLMNFKPGEIPTWAQGAVTTADEQMAARGLGSSSIAGTATTAALMSAALPIAAQDAQTYAAMGLANLNNQQQATIQNAQTLANMNLANLNNRQQAAVLNAQAFMQMDMANLSNAQQASVINQQSRQQSLLSDQSAQNAAAQFNATSENQVTQFFDNLNSQIGQFNAAQGNAMNQFNAGQANAIDQFNANMTNQRQQFNAQNQLVIDQSNVQWRRAINTANTAAQNAANQFNAQNLLGISNTAMNNLWQQFRDQAQFAFVGQQNANNINANIAIASMNNGFQQSLFNQQQNAAMLAQLGGFGANLLGNVLQNGA